MMWEDPQASMEQSRLVKLDLYRRDVSCRSCTTALPGYFEFNGRLGFLMEEAVLVSQKGEALDEKTPHLRSVDAIICDGGRLFRLLGDTESHEMVSK